MFYKVVEEAELKKDPLINCDFYCYEITVIN